jgi:arsenate reductase (thioredoxin)
MKEKVLFVCIHNSARSQMAEAFLNRTCGSHFEAQSAGLEPGRLNPFVVQAMAEIGIDISGNRTKSVFDLQKMGETFQHVVAVCDSEAAEKCPVFPGAGTKLHWNFPDPSSVQGSDAEKLAKAREVRDTIKSRIELWCREVCPQQVGGKAFDH